MPRIYNVNRSSTDKLIDALNDATREGCTVELIQWVGGRDWVVIYYRDDAEPANDRFVRAAVERARNRTEGQRG